MLRRPPTEQGSKVLADLDRLDVITTERSRELRRRVLAAKYAERIPVQSETYAGTLMPEELRRPLIERALLRDAHPAAGIALLFSHLATVPGPIVDRALGREVRRWLADAGVLHIEDGRVTSALRLHVADGVFIWSDDPSGGADAVMPPGPTTVDLIRVMPETLSGSVADIGTGPGSFALIAARRGATRVVATDVNPRALELARFNARFNELTLEVREGDMFAPLGDERFDRVLSQPPYVTHPPSEPGVTFLHGGEKGDELAFRFLDGLGAHLAPDGIGMALFDSPVRIEADIGDRVRRALGAAPDVVVFSQPGIAMDRQALGYAALADPTFGQRYRDAAVRYRDHLERQRIDAVTHSLVIVRAPRGSDAAGWTMSIEVARFPERWAEALEFIRGIELAVAGEEAIAEAHVRPRDGMTMHIERAAGASRDAETRSVRFARPSIALDRELTPAGAVIFDLLAAEASVGSAILRFAKAMERPPAEVRPLVTSFVKDCLVRALLVPADGEVIAVR